MTAEQYARIRAQDPRYRGKNFFFVTITNLLTLKSRFFSQGSSTLPRTTTRTGDSETGRTGDKVATATSSTSLYDNVASNSQIGGVSAGATGSGQASDGTGQRPVKSETGTMTSTEPMNTSTQNHVGSQSQDEQSTGTLQRQETSKSEGTQAGGTLQQSHTTKSTTSTGTEMHHNIINNNTRRSKSKSTEDMNIFSESSTLKRMMKPMPSTESPVTSPEMTRRRYNYYNAGTNTMHSHQHGMHNSHIINNNTLSRPSSQASRFSGSR